MTKIQNNLMTYADHVCQLISIAALHTLSSNTR